MSSVPSDITALSYSDSSTCDSTPDDKMSVAIVWPERAILCSSDPVSPRTSPPPSSTRVWSEVLEGPYASLYLPTRFIFMLE